MGGMTAPDPPSSSRGPGAPSELTPARPQPGETIPAARRPGATGWTFGARADSPAVVVARPDLVRATILGLAAGLLPAVLTALVLAVLSVTVGLIAIAVLGGWLVGLGVRTGAWSGRPHPPSRAPLALAATLGAITWVAGLVLAWIVSMVTLPASSMGVPDRLVANPFLDWLSPQLGPIDLVQLVLLVSLAWVAAHTTDLEREAARIPRR